MNGISVELFEYEVIILTNRKKIKNHLIGTVVI